MMVSKQWAGVTGPAAWKDIQQSAHVFTLRAPLRCDGIGRLDCAAHVETGERLAVRWLPLAANGEAAVRACEKLPTHPRLPRVVQTGTSDEFAFVAIEFPEGQLLSAAVGDRISLDNVLRLAADLSGALARIHDEATVHGELSAESVLLVNSGITTLWDVPLVVANRLTDRRGESRLVHNLKRVAPYLAPERLHGAGASQAADVYGLAAIVCVAAGAPLPQAETTLGLVHQVSMRNWVPRVPAIVPSRWAEVLNRMLSEDPSQRPSAHEVALAFTDVPVTSLPTVPELQAVRLPAALLATAEALSKKQIESVNHALAEAAAHTESTATREIPLIHVELLRTSSDACRSGELPSSAAPTGPLPLLPPPAPSTGPLTMTVDVGAAMDSPTPPELPTLVGVPVVASPDIALTPTIAVAAELAEQGAHSVPATSPIEKLGKRVWALIALMLLAILGLTVVAFRLALSRPAPGAPMAQQHLPSLDRKASSPAAELELAPVPLKRKLPVPSGTETDGR